MRAAGAFKYLKILLTIALLLSLSPLKGQYDRDNLFLRGRQSLIDGRYREAIVQLNLLVRIDSTLYEAYFFRGIAKYNLEDFLGAQSDFDKTLELNPLYTLAYHYRAITHSRIGKYELALKDLEEAVDLRPGYTGLYFSKGVTYFLSQQFDKAIEEFDKFLRREPKESDAYLNRGASYLYLGDTLKALSDYNMAISMNILDPEGYIRRARVYMMQERDSLAVEDLNSAIRLDSTNTFALFNRALVNYNQKQIERALSDLESVLKYEPGNALTLYNRALIRSQIGDYNNAIEDYNRVIEINPTNVLAYYNRASVFIELGRYRDAMDDYSQAINLYPDFANAYLNRSFVKNKLGQFNSARADYNTAQEKVKEYRERSKDTTYYATLADTTKKFDTLLALDADFAKKDFNDELLQYRDIDIRLKPLYRFRVAEEIQSFTALDKSYRSSQIENFVASLPVAMRFDAHPTDSSLAFANKYLAEVDSLLAFNKLGGVLFSKAVLESNRKQFNRALECYNLAIEGEPSQPFYYINRGVLQSEMIDFISSI
ncbi:MAG: tetratricopeptide repeat protein, partial [Bacteroidales bacterium]